MTRNIVLVIAIAMCGQSSAPAGDPPTRLSAEERKRLESELKELNDTGLKQYQAGKLTEATVTQEKAFAVARRLYPKDDFPNGHRELAACLTSLGGVLEERNLLAEAEPYYRQALAMHQRLHGEKDHPDVAEALNTLAILLRARAKFAEAEPHYRDALAMYRRLHKDKDHARVARAINNMAFICKTRGKLSEAEKHYRDALDMYRRLHSDQDDVELAVALNNLGDMLLNRGKFTDAEPLSRQALAMFRRIHKGKDHVYVAGALNNLARIYREQGRPSEAEPMYKESLAMFRRLFKDRDHPSIAVSLTNTASVLRDLEKFDEAEKLFQEALAMRRRLRAGQDHPDVANGLNSLAHFLQLRDRLEDAAPLFKQALEMNQRLYKGDHPAVARSMNNLAFVLDELGNSKDAEPLYRDALAMRRRLYPEGHRDVATSLSNLGALYHARGEPGKAEPFLTEALALHRKLTDDYAKDRSEGETLTLAASLAPLRDSVISVAIDRGAEPATVYATVWRSKAAITRLYEERHLRARAAATDPNAAGILVELAEIRRQRSDLLLAPASPDTETRQKQATALKALAQRIHELDSKLKSLLPDTERTQKLSNATPTDLRAVLGSGTAFVDLMGSKRFTWDPGKPGRAGEKHTRRFLAFVVTSEKVALVDLGRAEPIEKGISAWRSAITSSHGARTALAVNVRDLVWSKIRAQLPTGVKSVYISPDLALTQIPWAALPGDKPGTILLDDFAIAVVPHAPFLLDQLWPADPAPKPPADVLAVGGVGFDSDPPAGLWAAIARVTPTDRGEPALDRGKPLKWQALAGTQAEANGLSSLAQKSKLTCRLLTGEHATTDSILAALPKARIAHLATHGFFADERFRSVLQVDPKLFEMRGGERIGAGALSPMVMSGLVCAGANKPQTPGRGLLTGEMLIDRDLSGMELAVLSACETGLGDVAGGEGVFGLQRAFPVAGCRNVVASLWKVNDAATAALMVEFYRHLWDARNPLPPLEALRQAQLTIYREPKRILDLAKTLRGGLERVNLPAADPDGKAPVHLWAAFTLSGLGR
jgi:CHAT domain-containing protein/Tfp pilus assembly protein PilF